MTRFARAKGSKSSNERVPESATSWQDMKKDMLQKNEERDSQTDYSKITEKLFNNKQDKTVKWSEFPIMDQKTNLKPKTKDSVKQQDKNDQGTALHVAVRKNKKRKFQTSHSKSPEKTLNDTVEKNPKLDQNIGKKVQSAVQLESKLDEAKICNSETASSFKKKAKGFQQNASGGFGKETDKEQHKKISDTKGKGINNKPFEKNNRGEHKRRKPNSEIDKIFVNGNEIEISYYDGFPVKKIDADRLKELKKEMISRGLPRSEIAVALKLERRKAEKSLSREKKKVCFNCRNSGHTLSECPMLKSGSDAQLSETGICFKCGSTEHTHFQCKVNRSDNFKFAQCFICKEQGHIARQCPDNSKGLYPNGGSCRECGAVTHLKKDCPKYQSEQEEKKIVADTIDDYNIESLDNDGVKINSKPIRNSQKVIKF